MKMASLKKVCANQKIQLQTQNDSVTSIENAMTQLQEENQLLVTAFEKERLTLKECQKGINEMRIKLEEQKNMFEDMQKNLETALSDKRVAQQRCAVLKGENDSLNQSLKSFRQHGSNLAIEEQLRALQTAARCKVCNDKYKDTVLLTCYHVFCRDCVNNLMALRSRKCPNCQKSFDKMDIKTIYLDFDLNE